jgi:hypothetical protein
MSKIFNSKTLISNSIYIIVSILFYTLLTVSFSLGQNWFFYTPATIVGFIVWFITVSFFGHSTDGTITPGDPYLSFILFIVLHHVISFLIVNAITLIFKRKTLKQLLGN